MKPQEEKNQDTNQVKELKHFRKQLHWEAGRLVRKFEWLDRDKTVREVKNIFLWHFYKVETSRALTLDQLKEGIQKIKRLEKKSVLKHLEARNFIDVENQLHRLTDKQKKRLVRIMVYVLKLTLEQQISYIEKTVGIKTPIDGLTVFEADKVIQRVERWEAKVLLNK